MEIRRITCREAWENPAWPEVEKGYAKEVVYPDLPPDPDYETYLQLEKSGVLRSIGVFDGDKIVGFANYTLYRLPHFAGRNLAACESIWVDERYRRRGCGLRLCRAMFKFAKEDGVYGMYLGSKIGTNAAKLFEHLAVPMNLVFWKKL